MADRSPNLLAEHLERCWPEIAKFFAERNWPDTKLGNAASCINGDVPEIVRVLRGGWIPITERLPDDDMSVMIALRASSDPDDVWIGWHDGEMGWVCDNGPLGERVTHWMPMPEAPRG